MSKGVVGETLGRVDKWLWQPEPRSAPPLYRSAWYSSRVAYAIGRDIIDGHITLYAMSLVYTTLLSIVPFLALSFSVLKGFGVHNQLEPALERLVMTPLGPDKGTIVVENIINFVDNIKVGVLGSVGLAILIYTVVSLVQKIEYSFNEIWHIGRIRSIGQRFSSYLSVVVIGPVLIFGAVGATAAVVNNDLIRAITDIDQLAWLFEIFGRLVPYLIIVGLFTFLYIFIPNTKVRFKYALIGGAVAGITWQVASFVFTIFAAGSTRYDAIYSGFAVGIMVLIWMYLAWLILLVGAAVAYYAQHANQISRARSGEPAAILDEFTGLQVVYRVARRFDESGGGLSMSDIEADASINPATVRRVVKKLINHKLLAPAGSEEEELLPARSLDKLYVRQVLHALRIPNDPVPLPVGADRAVTDIVQQVDEALDKALDQKTLADWVREEHPEPGLTSAPQITTTTES